MRENGRHIDLELKGGREGGREGVCVKQTSRVSHRLHVRQCTI
jgi:hypothetical protein